MELVTTNYSSDMRNLIMYLLTNPNRVKSVNDLMPMIGKKAVFSYEILLPCHCLEWRDVPRTLHFCVVTLFASYFFTGARFYVALDDAHKRIDLMETEMARDVESARLFRLLTKLSTVVDRAELNGDESWSEYGDRYMLKLFRDYVFHQVGIQSVTPVFLELSRRVFNLLPLR